MKPNPISLAAIAPVLAAYAPPVLIGGAVLAGIWWLLEDDAAPLAGADADPTPPAEPAKPTCGSWDDWFLFGATAPAPAAGKPLHPTEHFPAGTAPVEEVLARQERARSVAADSATTLRVPSAPPRSAPVCSVSPCSFGHSAPRPVPIALAPLSQGAPRKRSPRVTPALLAEIFANGTRKMTRSEFRAAMAGRGYGKTAAYNALTSSASLVSETMDGYLLWSSAADSNWHPVEPRTQGVYRCKRRLKSAAGS